MGLTAHEKHESTTAPASALGMTGDELAREIEARLGCVSLTQSKDRLVGIYDAYQAGIDPAGGPWAVVCETHAAVQNVSTLKRARACAANPASFCGDCAARKGAP